MAKSRKKGSLAKAQSSQFPHFVFKTAKREYVFYAAFNVPKA